MTSILLLVLLAGIVAAGIYVFRDFKKGATSQPVASSPSAVANSRTNVRDLRTFPYGTTVLEVPSAGFMGHVRPEGMTDPVYVLAVEGSGWYERGSFTVERPAPGPVIAPTGRSEGVLSPGHGEHFAAGKSRWTLPNVAAGITLDITVSDSNGGIEVVLLSPAGTEIGRFSAANAGQRQFKAVFAGDYVVELQADAPGVVSHWRV